MIGFFDDLKSTIASRTSCTLRPQRRGAGRPDDDAGDAAIDLRLAQRLDHRTDGGWRLEERADQPAGLGLLEIAADPQDERRIRRHRRLAPHQQRGEHQPGRRNGDRDGDENDNEPDAAPASHSETFPGNCLPPSRTTRFRS